MSVWGGGGGGGSNVQWLMVSSLKTSCPWGMAAPTPFKGFVLFDFIATMSVVSGGVNSSDQGAANEACVC